MKSMNFFKKKMIFTTRFSSEQLQFSSFNKLLKNFSKNSGKKNCSHFGISKNNDLFLEQSSQIYSGHLKRRFDNPAETFGESLKIFNAKFGKLWKNIFSQAKVRQKFSAGELECSFDQNAEKILPEVWETLFHFLKLFICLLTNFFELWFNWSWKLSLKKLIWTREK